MSQNLVWFLFFLFSEPWSSPIKYWSEIRDGNGAGWGRRMGSSSPSRIVLSCVMPVPPYKTRKTFSPYPRPLGPCKAPPHPVKFYFLLICPTTSTIFLMKPISLIKIYLKLQLNLSHEIKSIFRKKLNNIFKCLTRQSIYIKKKN